MTRITWWMAALLGLSCSTPSTGSPQPEPVYYPGNTEGCVEVASVCLATDPPQCFEYCADAPPKKGSPCSGAGDVQTCGDSTCVVGKDENGKAAQVCVESDCTISYDASTGQETIHCGASDAGVSDSGGTVDGSSGS